jgi:hypothetical protein
MIMNIVINILSELIPLSRMAGQEKELYGKFAWMIADSLRSSYPL